jgi:transposase InsO family protein
MAADGLIGINSNELRFAETPPARIAPALADEGLYIASEASFHRVLRDHGQMNRRGRARPRTSRPPTTHIATRPGEVWCWEMTFLRAQIQGRWFYLYLILDLYSRKVVGFAHFDRIRGAGDRNLRSACPNPGRNNQTAEEPASGSKPCSGKLGDRSPRRMELLYKPPEPITFRRGYGAVPRDPSRQGV